MGRRAIIFDGTNANPSVAWYPWLAERLKARGFEVEVPHYPGLNVEPIAAFLPQVLAGHRFDADTVVVGHSGGAALLLALSRCWNAWSAEVSDPGTPPRATTTAGWARP
jgi:predicted alpha/beta hydrolase family esterase